MRFLLSHTVTALRATGGKLDHVEATDCGRPLPVPARRRVRAGAGQLEPALRRGRSGFGCRSIPAKGYSVTMPVRDPTRAFEVSLTDDEYKLVFSRLGEPACASPAPPS